MVSVMSDMQHGLLILGGVAGAAQLTVLSGLVAGDNPKFAFLRAAGWVLVTVPLGAIMGTSIVAMVMLLRGIRIRLSVVGSSFCFATAFGLPASLLAALLLLPSPDYYRYRYTFYAIEYI